MASLPTGSVAINAQFFRAPDGSIWQYFNSTYQFNQLYTADQVDEITDLLASIDYVDAEILAETNRATTREDDLEGLIDAVTGGVLNIIPTSSPTVNVFTYNASEAGTYTNFDGVEILEADLIGKVAQIRFIDDGWVKYVTDIADLVNYITKEQFNVYADAIFDRDDVDKFTPTLPVRRWTNSTTFNDYANGYSQTSNENGLLVQIPFIAGQAITYFLNTLQVITTKKTQLSFKITDLSFSTSAGVGIGYINSLGEYIGYWVSVLGIIRKTTNYTNSSSITTITALNVNDVVSFELFNNTLNIYINNVLKHSLVYDPALEFIGSILVVEKGNIYYNIYTNVYSTPVTDYVNNSIQTSKTEILGILDNELESYVDEAKLAEDAEDLFKSDVENLFPLHNLPVRRYTSDSVFLDRGAGFSQTSVSTGLFVEIPSAGSAAAMHFLNTMLPLPDTDEFRVRINITEYITVGGVGIGYINGSGEYIGLIFTSTGDFRKIVNYSIVYQSAVISPYSGTVVFDFVIKDGLLSIIKDGVAVYGYDLVAEGFIGNLLIVQRGFAKYITKTNAISDPIRVYVEENSATNLPSAFYSYDPEGTPNGEVGQPANGLFKAYTRVVGTNKYIGYNVAHEVDARPLIYQDYWRVAQGDWYIYDGGVMSPLGKIATQSGENECTYKRPSKDDFTGGYHGDELVTDVRFYAGGVLIEEPSEVVELTPCTEFSYLEKSTMHASPEGSVIIPGHPIDCDHIKHTIFKDGGYTTFNRLTWAINSLISIWYHGIYCFGKDNGTVAYCESNFTDVTMTGSSLGIRDNVGFREVYYRNNTNQLGGFVTSTLLKPFAYDATCDVFVDDRTLDSKYYREITGKTPDLNEVWESIMTVKHTSLD